MSAGNEQLHGSESHNLRMDVDRAESGTEVARLRRIVKTKDQHIFRNRLPYGEQVADQITCYEIVGADKHLRKLFQICNRFYDLFMATRNAV